MGILKRERQEKLAALSVQSGGRENWPGLRGLAAGPGERMLYRELRAAVPLIDAAIYKLCRLIGEFRVECPDPGAQRALAQFLDTVQVGAAGRGASSFIATYLEELLTYGNAVGELVVQGGSLRALYNADLEQLELEEDGPMAVKITVRQPGGGKRPCPYPELLLFSALNPPAGSPWGTSILRGLPFVSEILMKIYRTLGVNWDRMGNVRFAVTCKPDGSGFPAAERARQMAEEWRRAMQAGQVSDFVAVGDVSIRAIGADNQLLDSDVPVRQMLEQIVGKLGLPPFLLGLSWSSTERMSSQQADVLTSELEAYRRLLSPVIRRIASVWLALEGCDPNCTVVWDDITMQDEVDHANARYLTARARKLEKELESEETA